MSKNWREMPPSAARTRVKVKAYTAACEAPKAQLAPEHAALEEADQRASEALQSALQTYWPWRHLDAHAAAEIEWAEVEAAQAREACERFLAMRPEALERVRREHSITTRR